MEEKQKTVEHYDNIRLNSAIGYITPKEMRRGASRRFTTNETGSWQRLGNSGRSVGRLAVILSRGSG